MFGLIGGGSKAGVQLGPLGCSQDEPEGSEGDILLGLLTQRLDRSCSQWDCWFLGSSCLLLCILYRRIYLMTMFGPCAVPLTHQVLPSPPSTPNLFLFGMNYSKKQRSPNKTNGN